MDAIPYKLRVAKAVTEAMAAKGENTYSLADKTQIPRTTLRRKLAGTGKPIDVEELDLIAKALKTSVIKLARAAS